jgi:hypothetical protein
MKRLFSLLGLILLALAACNNNAPVSGGGTPVPTVSPIEWERKPETIVFRADVVGGNPSFVSRSETPPCTIYGDNRVVWRNELGGFQVQVLFDKLTDEQIRNFITYLTINERFFEFKANADLQPPSSTAPVVETISLSINGTTQKSDGFSSWPTDYYARVLRACKTLSAAPVLFEPQAAWVSAQVVPYNTNVPGLVWDDAASGLKLADLAARKDRQWITDRNVKVLWNIMRNAPANTQFIEGDGLYEIALEVPNITRDAPPEPKSG